MRKATRMSRISRVPVEPQKKRARISITLDDLGVGELRGLARACLEELLKRATDRKTTTPNNVAYASALATARQMILAHGYDDDEDEV